MSPGFSLTFCLGSGGGYADDHLEMEDLESRYFQFHGVNGTIREQDRFDST